MRERRWPRVVARATLPVSGGMTSRRGTARSRGTSEDFVWTTERSLALFRFGRGTARHRGVPRLHGLKARATRAGGSRLELFQQIDAGFPASRGAKPPKPRPAVASDDIFSLTSG